MNIAIIPARGGSKRIPGKNIKPFLGKPLIGYSIEAAIETGLFDHVFVSTDSQEIARIASDFGAEIPFMRSKDLSDDHTGTDDVVLDMLFRLQEKNISSEFVCCIYATAPFINPLDLKRGYEILCSTKASSAFTITTFPAPIFRSLKLNENDRLEMFWPKYRKIRSQDLPEAYHDAGQFYWAHTKRYLKDKSFWSNDAVPIQLPRYRVQDIDTMEDWSRAEKLFSIMEKLNG